MSNRTCIEGSEIMPDKWTETVSICPVYKFPPNNEYWVKCPMMEGTSKPAGSIANDIGCKLSDGNPNTSCVTEVRMAELSDFNGPLAGFFPDFEKLLRSSALCPLIQRGQVEEIHSSERLFFAPDTEETHLIRLFLLSVTAPNVPQFYWPVGFEVTGYEPGLQLPVVRYSRGSHPEYCVEFSSIAFDVLVERNNA